MEVFALKATGEEGWALGLRMFGFKSLFCDPGKST